MTEPWGDFVEIAPSASIVVVAEGPIGNGLEFSEMKESESAVYGWSGSTIRITNDNGEELWISPIPAL